MRINLASILVDDQEKALRFYTDVLGAERVELAYGRFAYRFGDQQLNVHGPGSTPHPRAADPVRPGNSDLCFLWPGPISDAVAHLEEHGVAVEEGPVERQGAGGTGQSVYFRDPDGHLWEIIWNPPTENTKQ